MAQWSACHGDDIHRLMAFLPARDAQGALDRHHVGIIAAARDDDVIAARAFVIGGVEFDPARLWPTPGADPGKMCIRDRGKGGGG